MLRACIATSSRSFSRPSAVASYISLFHTSTPLQAAASSRQRNARATRKENRALKEERLRTAQARKPSAVLGTRPGEESKWLNCDLAKTVVTADSIAASSEYVPVEHANDLFRIPKELAYGVGETEKTLLFAALPTLSAEARVPQSRDFIQANQSLHMSEALELSKAAILARLLDLGNADAGGIAFENRRRIITEFSGADNAFDTGRPEVQAALLTYKIRNLWDHLSKFKRDVGNRRGLRKLVHQRAKILRYLRRLDRDRYDRVLERLALEPESVEGELVV